MTRLDCVLPDLAAKLQASLPPKQRAAALVACEFAIAHAQVQHPLVQSTLDKLRATGVLSVNERRDLDALTVRLDNEYFDLQEAAEQGKASREDYLRAFEKARAVAALSYAGRENSLEAANEAICEAAATVDDRRRLVALLEAVLKRD
jgi:hypothetical protein